MYTIKLVHEDDIRKVALDNTSVASLYETIKGLFVQLANVSFDDIYLYYFDNESDKIRIKFDAELREAFSQTSSVLKVFVQRVNPASPTTTTPTPTQYTTNPQANTNLDPLLGMINNMAPMVMNNFTPAVLNNMAPMLLNNPALMQQITSMIPTMLASMLGGNAQNSSSTSSPSPPQVNMSASAFAMLPPTNNATPAPIVPLSPLLTLPLVTALLSPTSPSTSTTSSTTQTAQGASSTQTTQTQQNPACATQTTQGVSATQTTQTQQNPACATQTQQIPARETQSAQAQTTTEATPNPFYDSLAGSKFGSLLEQLQELGFTDKEKCVHALVKYGGRLAEAIDELLLDQLLE